MKTCDVGVNHLMLRDGVEMRHEGHGSVLGVTDQEKALGGILVFVLDDFTLLSS